jgi:hypothetical protein
MRNSLPTTAKSCPRPSVTIFQSRLRKRSRSTPSRRLRHSRKSLKGIATRARHGSWNGTPACPG